MWGDREAQRLYVGQCAHIILPAGRLMTSICSVDVTVSSANAAADSSAALCKERQWRIFEEVTIRRYARLPDQSIDDCLIVIKLSLLAISRLIRVMDAVSSASNGGQVVSPLRVMALRRSYANRKSISASEADDVESVRRRHPSIESKCRSSDVSGAYTWQLPRLFSTGDRPVLYFHWLVKILCPTCHKKVISASNILSFSSQLGTEESEPNATKGDAYQWT